MASDKVPGSQAASLSLGAAARRRGRVGLAVPWENIPWWGIIILIVGVIVGYSVLILCDSRVSPANGRTGS